MTDEQRKKLVDILMVRREAHVIVANKLLYEVVHEGCRLDIAALEPAINEMVGHAEDQT